MSELHLVVTESSVRILEHFANAWGVTVKDVHEALVLAAVSELDAVDIAKALGGVTVDSSPPGLPRRCPHCGAAVYLTTSGTMVDEDGARHLDSCEAV